MQKKMATALTATTAQTSAAAPKIIELPSNPTDTPMATSASTTASEMPMPSSSPSTPPMSSVAFVAHQPLQQQQQQQEQEDHQQQLPQHRPLITIATQTALRRQDIPTMYHFAYDFSDKENKIASIEDTETAASLSLTPCPICSRRFNTESLRKHIVICEKNAAKKRKPFDSSRQRREGTELAEFAPKMQSTKASPEADEKSTRSLNVDSKRKQAASNNSNGSNNNTAAATVPLSPKPNASNGSAPNANASKNERASTNERPKRAQAMAPPSTQCPHCDRHFGVKAYDRHVEWCKEKSMQTAMKGNTSEKVKAKERLAARTKYRAPIKTKRSLNREKYAGLTADENEEEDSPKAMSSSMISNSKEEDNVSISSQTSYQFSREAFEAEMSLNEEKTKNSVESELKRVLVREAPSNYEQNQDTRRNSYHQEYEENPSEEACMQTNKNVICRGARQFAEPNSGLPFPKNQYFVDDAYPMQRSSSSLYMQQQMEQQMLQQMQHKQQMQMQMQPCYSSLDSFPNPFINFDASPAEMIRKKKKKTHRKSANLGQVLNPNMPMKAFSMPFQDPNMLPMQQNMYEQMMSTFSNTSLCDWALPVDGDAHSYIQDQSNVVPTKTRSKRSCTKTSLNRTEMRNDDFHSACSGDSTSLAGDGQAIQNDLQEEQNDEHDRPSISPNSLRNLVGNSQAVVEVEVDAKENKFSKITDADDNNGNINRDENGNNHQLPNVEMNNAKNLIQKMGEDNREICNEDLHDNNNEKANNAKIDGTGDSDEMSSLEGYPFASNSCSRLSAGVASKMSADSAYGSLSRQRSTELMGRSAPRSSSHTRPATAATSNISQLQQQQQFLLQQQYQQQLMLQQQKQQQQQQLKYAQAMLKNSRMRQLSGSSSSSSDNSLPPILVPNPNSFQQQQFLLQQQQQQHQMGQLYQQKPRHRSSPVAATIPMSRFCHECGSKYLVDNAKFCMDCGAKRLMM